MGKILKMILLTFSFVAVAFAFSACGSGNDLAANATPTIAPTVVPKQKIEPDAPSAYDFTENLGKEENNQWNLNNGGYIARSGTKYYYSDEKYGLLYSVNLDSTQRVKFDVEPFVGNINVIDGNIYYTSSFYTSITKTQGVLKKESSKIIKKSLDGRNKNITNVQASLMICDPAYIFYTNLNDSNKLYRCDLNFQNVRKLTDEKDVKNFYLSGEYIYYLTKDGIMRMKNDGQQRTKEVESAGIKNFGLSNGFLFFLFEGNGYLYRAPIEKTSERSLLANQVIDFFVNGENIFYRNSGSYMKANLANVSTTVESQNITGAISIIGNVIFISHSAETGDFLAPGYSTKRRIDKKVEQPIAKDEVDAKVGIDIAGINDYVALNVEYNDRKKIAVEISKGINKFFIGNSIPIYSTVADINEDRMEEMFVVFVQNISEQSSAMNGIPVRNGMQFAMEVFKWDKRKFVEMGPYPIQNDIILRRDLFLKANLRQIDLDPGGFKELVFSFGDRGSGNLDLYKVYPTYIEQLNKKPYESLLINYGY